MNRRDVNVGIGATLAGLALDGAAGTAAAQGSGGVRAQDILWVGVYPPLGIARVGNAAGPDDFTIAPDLRGGRPEAPGGFQTADGAIKRQAARFRVYAKLRSGRFAELTNSPTTGIEWRVEVANLKAGWYQFGQAMDLPAPYARDAKRRNAGFAGRERLDIRPRSRRIAGNNLSGPGYRFDDGRVAGRAVALGELRTDAQGRLLFLGGTGVSAPFGADPRPTTFANNDGWHDDIADGPVRATVTVDGTAFEAEPGYVAVTPPNYAPGLSGLVSMDDTVRETFFAAGWLVRPDATSFTRDVWPIFQRLTDMQWVNHGLFVAHGAGSPLDARDERVIARLGDASSGNKAWRERVFALFRAPGASGPASQLQLPYVYGDLFGEARDPGATLLAVTPAMHAHLDRWAAGAFDADWHGPPAPVDFAALNADGQVAELLRTGLAECLGGPFHPGIELSWTLRRPELWALHHRPEAGERALYRLHLVPEGEPVRQDFGEVLTPAACLAPGGATAAAGPGALTRWLGVPWQTDEASCNSGADYEPSTYLSMPSYWGARVPDQVLSTEAWNLSSGETPGSADASSLQRLKQLLYREDWLRDVRGRSYPERLENMVRDWATLGVVEPRAATDWMRAAGFPAEAHVETGRDRQNAGSNPKTAVVASIQALGGGEELQAGLAQSRLRAAASVTPPRRRFGQGEI